MSECLLCHRGNLYQPSLRQLMSFRPVVQLPVCQRCMADFEPIQSDQACQSCGRVSDQLMCSDCERWPQEVFFKNRALYRYNSALKQFMSQYKFNGDYRLRLTFQAQFARVIKQLKPDLVVPIPLAPTTRQNRGFNQVIGFLEMVEVFDGLQSITQTKTVPQSTKSRQQRLLTKQPFELAVPPDVFRKKQILIVDDIYTTGRTIRHAADLLLAAGAAEVSGLTLAHG